MNRIKIKSFTKLLLVPFFLFFSVSFSSRGVTALSNIDGKIKAVILHFGNGSYFDGFWFDMTLLFRELLEKMERDVGFVILLGEDENARRVRRALKPYEKQQLPDGTGRIKYLAVDVKTGNFYPWARDAYIIQSDKKGNLVFLDTGFNFRPFPVTDFHRVFKGAVTHAGMVRRGGGNIRTTEREIFLGIDTILGMDMTPRWSPYGHIKETFYSVSEQYQGSDIFGLKKNFNAHADFLHRVLAPDKKLVIPGKEQFFRDLENGDFVFNKKTVYHTGAQAAYHTDVYLGTGHRDKEGRRILFIADSGAGVKIVRGLSGPRRRAVERSLPFVLEREGFTAAGVPVTAKQIEKRFRWSRHRLLDLCSEKGNELKPVLDRTARHLESLGFRIIRIPSLPNGLNNSGKKNDRVMGVSFNYSNVLLEAYGTTRRAYIPQYGFDELDRAAGAAYEKAGYRVVFIRGLLTGAVTSRNDGKGLDCFASEIRGPVKWVR